ncbi:hypothetical protein Nepgr_019680 [Nepenthes gracilis]|uniref:Uncharacterized protein n=1 Tax=Nepenthes gracilis TaxID=150966 RepID=A0AAD3SWA2_NEPGR|nr:hypothetical protein Nepgr_019680 [Nepenthes gracilis]
MQTQPWSRYGFRWDESRANCSNRMAFKRGYYQWYELELAKWSNKLRRSGILAETLAEIEKREWSHRLTTRKMGGKREILYLI